MINSGDLVTLKWLGRNLGCSTTARSTDFLLKKPRVLHLVIAVCGFDIMVLRMMTATDGGKGGTLLGWSAIRDFEVVK